MNEHKADSAPVLVVGATGDLGGRVVRELLARGKHVRALVREGSDADSLAAEGVEIARGDLLDPDSLDRALAGAGAVVTTATDYTRNGTSDPMVDDQGNRNLVDAAVHAGIERFVFASVATADRAQSVETSCGARPCRPPERGSCAGRKPQPQLRRRSSSSTLARVRQSTTSPVSWDSTASGSSGKRSPRHRGPRPLRES